MGDLAKEDRIVTETLEHGVEVQRLVFAGQAIPPNLVEAYNDATGDKAATKAVRAPEKDKALRAPDASK